MVEDTSQKTRENQENVLARFPLKKIMQRAQTFVLHNIFSQNAILFCWLVPRHFQMMRTFLNDFQISHRTWSY